MSDPDHTAATCDFCAIARGEDPRVEVVCQAENWVAFFPLSPATPGHTLVIPRIHVTDLWKVVSPLDAELMAAVIKVGRAIQVSLNPEGMNLITSAGESAEQTVFHLHLHVVPRWRRDGFDRIWPPAGRYEDDTFEDVADRVRRACAETAF